MNEVKNIPTPHIEAMAGEIAKTVLMPGDPLRAKFVAENYLSDVKCFNNVRGMLGFTGKYNGEEVSVMGSGMGMPSIGIYSFELFSFYGVENIIRIGSCGAFLPEIKVLDLILAEAAHSESTFYEVLTGKEDKVLFPSKKINKTITQSAEELSKKMMTAPIFSSDVFYSMQNDYYKVQASSGAVAVEMESFALFANALVLNKNAACLLTVSDNIATRELVGSEERQKSFRDMMEVALNAAVKL